MANELLNATRGFVGQGLGMGWGDEAEAWLREKAGQGTYEDNVNRIRQEYGDYAKKNPFMAGANELAGGVVPGVAAMFLPGMQASGAGQVSGSTLKALAKMGLLGSATGAVSGQGNATEGNRTKGAVSGALLGGAVGVGIPLAAKAAGATLRWAGDRVSASPQRIAARSAEKMNAALEQSGLKPSDITRILSEDKAMTVPSVVANTGRGLTDLAETVAQRTGAGARQIEDTLISQKLGARERAYSQAVKGLKPGNYYDDEQRLVKDLRDSAGSLYDTAYQHGAVNDPRINEVLQHPEFKSFFDKAQGIAKSEAMAAKLRGEDPSKFLLPELYTLELDPVTQVMTPKVTRLPDVRTLDYMKRGIDATIDSGFRGQGMSTAEAQALKQLRNQFVSAIDDNVPAYATARKGYAGDMEVIDALRAGMNDFGKLDHEQVVKMVAGMSSAEKDAFRTGVTRDIYSKIMGPSGNYNAAQRVIGSPEMREKLKPLFNNPGEYKLFEAALQRESQLFSEANRVLGGSQTGKRMQMRENFESDGDVGQAVAQAIQSGPLNSLLGLASRAIGNTQMTEATATKLADMLMSKDPHAVASVVKLLEEQAAAAGPRALRMGMGEAGAVTGVTSAIWPSPQGTSTPVSLSEGETQTSPNSAPSASAQENQPHWAD